jgi:hypothetical protein
VGEPSGGSCDQRGGAQGLEGQFWEVQALRFFLSVVHRERRTFFSAGTTCSKMRLLRATAQALAQR